MRIFGEFDLDEWIDILSLQDSSDQFRRESRQQKIDNSADWFRPLEVFRSAFESASCVLTLLQVLDCSEPL